MAFFKLGDPVKVISIHSKEEYELALKEAESLMSAEKGTPEGDRLDKLGELLEAYEREHHPIGRGN